MGRLAMYHSLVAMIRRDRDGKAFVRVLDREYSGPPGPEYTTVVNALDPYEARALADELQRAAREADDKNARRQIIEDAKQTAAAAKAEANL